MDGRYTETILPTEHMENLLDRDTLGRRDGGRGEETETKVDNIQNELTMWFNPRMIGRGRASLMEGGSNNGQGLAINEKSFF